MPTEGFRRDDGHLLRFLKGLALRFQILSALDILLLLASYVLLILLGGLFVPSLHGLHPYFPFLYSMLAILCFGALALMGTWRIASESTLERLAKGLEKKFPQLRDDVTNSLLLLRQLEGRSSCQISKALVMAHVRRTSEELSKIDPNQMVNLRPALRHLKLLIPLSVAFSVVFSFDPHFVNRSLATLLHPFSAFPSPETLISLEPLRPVVLRGTPLEFRAKASGHIPPLLTLILWPEGGEEMRVEMESEGGGRFNYWMGSAQASLRYQAVGARASSPIYSVRVVDPPEIGKVKLTLIPPDYTRLSKETRDDGHVEALRGTVVHLEAWCNKPVKEGKLLLSQGSPLGLTTAGEYLTGSLVILSPSSYSIRIKDEQGFENLNPVEYRIHVLPDRIPEGEILSPEEDLEVSGTEIIPIGYAARDDFGITAVRLSYQMAGREHFINLDTTRNGRSLGPEVFQWDLAGLALTAGDRVVYRLEVWDNDTVSGPKAGYSRAFTLHIRDARDRAGKEVEEAEAIAEALLDLLADQLEDLRDREALSKEIKEVLERVDKNLQRMGERPERFDLEALKRNLASLDRRIHEESKEAITQEMERLAHLAEEMAKKVRMKEIEAIGREFRNRQRRLIDGLRDLKGPLTPEVLRDLLREVEKLRELLHSVMEALSKMASQLPNEFINSPELSGLEFQDLFKDLDDLEKKLLGGDLAGALEAAERLLQSLSEMMAALSRAGAQASMGSFDRVQSEMSRQTSELERILREQREILAATEGIDKALKEKTEVETSRRRNDLMPRFQNLLKELERSLPTEQRDAGRELERILRAGQLERFFHLARTLKEELSEDSEAEELIGELMSLLDELVPDPGEVMSSEDREKFPSLASRQGSLGKRTRSLQERLEMLAQLFPGMDTEILKDLKDAAEAMGKASKRLEGEDARGAIPPEQEAIRSLSKSEQAMQQMSQQMAMQMQANRWGYPLAYDPRPGWYYGPWVPMPTLPQPEFRRPREKGYTGIDREEFEPPPREAYRAPRRLREMIMEALKEEVPSSYRKEVERYFRSLTE